MAGGLVTVASGRAPHIDEVAIRIANRRGALHPARPGQGREVVLPEVRFLHLFVPRGTVTLEGAGELAEGDPVRFTATGGQRVTGVTDAEIQVWEMHAAQSV